MVVAIAVSVLACRTYDTIYTDDAGGQCVAPSALCDVTCTDITSDRLHCGNCNTTCSVNALCSASSCRPCPGSSEIVCGTNGAAFCTDVSSDRQNCGACNSPCGVGETCLSGKCSCPLTTCGTQCVDTASDVNHCGGCDTACPPPAASEVAVCSAGHCSVQCVAPFADCDGNGANGCEANLETSKKHCGSCTHDCGGAQACTAGFCPVTTYASGSQLAGLAVDATNVYWIDQASSGIMSRAIAGGSPQVVFADNIATVLAVDSARIAWMHLNTQIEARLLSGGSTTLLATTTGAQALVASNGYAYFSTASNDVSRVPLDGSTGAGVVTMGLTPVSLAVDATKVYAATTGGDVISAPIASQNASPTLFAAGESAIDLAIDATNVYWATSTGVLVSHAKSSSSGTQIVQNENVVTNLVTDGVALYWGNADGSVRKAAVTGGAASKLATSQGKITVVAVDGTNIYWNSQVAVRSTPK